MDVIDAQIIRALNWHPLNPVDVERGPMGVWDVARHLDVHGNTVKRRIADMEEAGVLQGIGMFPNSVHAGMSVSGYIYWFEDGAACRAAEEAVLAQNRPGVVSRVAGNGLMINIGAKDEPGLQAAAAETAEGLGAASYELQTPRYWQPQELTDLEHRILGRMLTDPLASPPAVAERVGVKAATVRRLTRSLREKQAFAVVPFVHWHKAQGMQPVCIQVSTDGDVAAMHRVLRAAPELLMGGIPEAPSIVFSGFVATQGEHVDLLERIEAVPGVTLVRPHVMLTWRWSGLPRNTENITQALARLEQWDTDYENT